MGGGQTKRERGLESRVEAKQMAEEGRESCSEARGQAEGSNPKL